MHRASDPCPLFALWSVAVSKSSYTRYTSMSPDAHLRTDRMPRVRGPPSARRRGRWSARPRGRAPSPTSPVPHTLYSTIPEAELRTTDRVTRPPTIKHITLPRPTSFFYYFLFFEKGSVESTHKVPTSHYRTKHCHAAVAPLGGLTHRRRFSRIRPPPRPGHATSIGPRPIVHVTGPPCPPKGKKSQLQGHAVHRWRGCAL